MRIRLTFTATALLLAACATVPKPLTGEFAAITPEQAREGGTARVERVRWGGEIIRVDPGRETTCFEILARPLGSDARPLLRDRSLGRFLACGSGFYDPEVYVHGREVTVTGTLDDSEWRKVGEYDYLYPRVAADTIHLWAKRPQYVQVSQPSPWFWDPFWPDRYWWGPPPVIVVHPRPAPPPPPKPTGG
mgnify:CR=1 FL=1